MDNVFVSNGSTIPYTSAAALANGELVIEGELIGIAAAACEAGGTVGLHCAGIFDCGISNEAFGVGDPVYATSAGVITATAGSNTQIGIALETVASGVSHVRIFLGN